MKNKNDYAKSEELTSSDSSTFRRQNVQSHRGRPGLLLLYSAIVILFLISCNTVQAAVIYVPEDYPTIQKAVDNATAGDTVVIRDGNYTESLIIDKSLSLLSENGSANCFIEIPDFSDGIQINSDFVNLSGFTITGSYVFSVSNIVIEADFCNISDNVIMNNHYGIFLNSSSGNIIQNNYFSNFRGSSVYLFDSEGNLISDNRFYESQNGVFLSDSDDNSVFNNSFHDNGLEVFNSHQNGIINNSVNGKPLVYLENESDTSVGYAGQVVMINCENISVSNQNLSNTSTGLLMWNSSNCSVLNCTLSNDMTGLKLFSSENIEISGNNINNNLLGGIEIQNSENIVISANSITDNEMTIWVDDFSPSNIFSGNNISFNTYGLCLESSENVISDNLFINNEFYGVYIGNPDNIISGNEISGNDCGIQCDSDNNTITENIISANLWSGIELYGSNNIITRNNILNNGMYGIYIDELGNNSIYLNNFLNNTENVYPYLSSNIWHSAELAYRYLGFNFTGYLGNYWDDFEGADSNFDGVGDTAYNLGNEQDKYPLIQSFENYEIIGQYQMPSAPSIPMFIYGMVFDIDLSQKAPENTTIFVITNRGESVEGRVDENGWYGQPISNRLVIPECDWFSVTIDLNWTMVHLGPYDWEEGKIERRDLNYSTTPPLSVSNLTATTGNFWINWTWDNPPDSDFGSVMIYLDGVLETSIQENSYNRTFAPHETHKISIRTRDIFGNINTTWVNSTATILNNPPKIFPMENLVIEQGDTAAIRLNATDIDNDSLTYSCNNTEMLAEFNVTTGEGLISSVNCTPGEYVIEFGVADSYGGYDNTTLNVTVNEVFVAIANLTASNDFLKTKTGSNATFILNLNNTGNLADNFTLVVDSTVSAILSDTSLRLNVSENRTLTLNVSSGSKGTYRINVTAIPESFPQNYDFVNLTVEFEEPVRVTGRGGGGGQYGIGYIPLSNNLVPVIEFAPEEPAVNISINFDASSSYGINASIVNYSWDFGDDSSGEGVTVNHSYIMPGTYMVTLKVVDEEGRSNSTSIEVNVSNETILFLTPPTPENNSILNYSSITINVTSNKPLSHLILSWNGKIEEMNGSDFYWWLNKEGLEDGIHSFTVLADNATSELRIIEIDTESPLIEDLTYLSGSDWIKWTWVSPEDLVRIEVYLNGELQEVTDNQLNITNLEPGSYTLEIRTFDDAGNSAYVSQTVEISPAPTTPIPSTISKIIKIIPVEIIKEEEDVKDIINRTGFIKIDYITLIEKVIIVFDYGNETGYRITHNLTITESNATDSDLLIILDVSKSIAEDVGSIILPSNVIVIESDPIVGVNIGSAEKGRSGRMEATIITAVEENEFLNGIEVTHKIIPSEKEAKDVSSFPQTQIILIVAGVVSAVVIFIALKRRT